MTFSEIPEGQNGGYDKFAKGIKPGNAPDVMNVDYQALPDLVTQGLLADSSELLGETVARAPKRVRALVTLGGKEWAAPFDVAPQVVYYRKDLFEKHEIDVPRTWEEYEPAKIGMVHTYWSVLVPSLVNRLRRLSTRVFSQGCAPGEVLEATRRDGPGEPHTFFAISLPMRKPAFVTIFLFSFTASWNNFFLPLVMLNNHELYPVGLGLFNGNVRFSQNPEMYALVITGALV